MFGLRRDVRIHVACENLSSCPELPQSIVAVSEIVIKESVRSSQRSLAGVSDYLDPPHHSPG